MITESVTDPVYQYRFFDARPDTKTSGQWSVWKTCNPGTHKLFVEIIDGEQNDKLLYQVRVLNVVTSYPTDAHIKDNYKVKS